MHNPEFNPQQEAQLSAFLACQNQAMSFAQCQGYLFAVICSAEPLDVHQWLEVIIPQANGEMPEDMLFSFMALYHKISEQVFETGYKLPYHNEKQHEALKQWSLGFKQGATPYIDKLAQSTALDREFKEALHGAFGSLCFFSLPLEQVTLIAEQSNQSVSNVYQQQFELMEDFSLGFAELVEIVAVQSGLYDDEEGWD